MLACTTLPALILGGSPGPDPEATYESWAGCDGGAERAWPGRRAGVAVSRRRRRRGGHRSRGAYRATRKAVMTLHRPHGSLADGTDPIALTPDDAGWSFTGLRVLSLAPGVERSIATGDSEACVLPMSATDVTVRCDGERVRPRRAVVRVRQGDRLRVRAARRDGDDRSRHQAVRSRSATARCERRLDPSVRPGGGRGGRDPRRRSGDAPGHELHEPRGVGARRQADVRRAADAGRQLVELSAPPPRRLARVPGEQRGDLLLPDRPRRQHRRSRPTASACTARTRPTDRSTRTWWSATATCSCVPRGYHGPCIAAPGYTDVLPQRARRTGRRAVDGVLRRPGPSLGPRHVDGHGARPARAR